ncbi:hypothetical protein HFP57_14445 [Parasphingopyxis algicola]|uniref:hypothetical protein n=1 Tax=Parasphingopyxis algicola TaxID=2026624 RepID=UPI0015A1B6E4|nr:hypothetical protein [Parasphingopyxis algicola]QLC26102.1 hypothetical protein HFP57_14445 [Parasphingopyxis algicola]
MRKTIAITGALAVAGCATTVPPSVPTTTSRPMTNTVGLERVIGRSATQLVSLFGDPAQDFREEGARKLQFAGDACVLDTYLYPERRGREPVVTYVDARNATGEDVDRAACVEALARR